MENLDKRVETVNDHNTETEALAKVECTADLSDTREKKVDTFLYRAGKVVTACLLGVVIMGGAVYSYNQRKGAYLVEYEGKSLGYIRHREDAVKAFAAVKEEIKEYDPSININENFQVVKTLSNTKEYITGEEIESEISSGIIEEFTSYAIMVNGNEMAIVGTEEEAKSVIEDTENYFASKEVKAGVEVLDVNILDDIQVVEKVIDRTKLSDSKKALENLTATIGTTKQYIIKEGESLWTISRKTNMGIEEIVALNPGLNAEKVKIGQILNLSVSEPVLKVEVKLKITSNESIAYNTKYTTDKSMYKGKTKVVAKGENGVKKVVTEVTKVNGAVTDSKVAGSTVTKKPVEQVVAKGSKQQYVAMANIAGGGGSGIFGWPIKGSISSGYGSRGGGYHKGLDIRAPKNTPIYASDAGTVSIAGWYYGYGLLVKINHGDGYETYYGHCNSLAVKVGQKVKKGQYIAAVGSTGDSTGYHVHFEVRKNGAPQNPNRYLK